MRHRFFALLPLSIFVLSILALSPAFAEEAAKASEKAAAKTPEIETMKQDVAKKETTDHVVKTGDILTEHVMGNASAPVTIIEYASLNCSHCAHFHKDILPEVVKKYISTGKVKLIYRDFPLNAMALKAAQLSQCMPEDRYFPFVKTLFENQDAWNSAADPEATLTQYAKLAGLPGERITKCLADKNLQDALVKRRMQAENQFKINATPSFVINYGAETISGIGTFEDFDKAIAKYVK
ncbi:MAG: DsbA family protein [Alphaproteobacteria bacterium]|nr:DsbA family protein [Alphaproteobacteria bacterium]